MNSEKPASLGSDKDWKLFLAANIFLGIGACVDASAFNNYLKSSFDLDVTRRTFLEFPRETPGFLVSIFIAFLAGAGDVRIAAFANLLACLGMFALGVIPPVYGLMLATVFVYSAGVHLFMPLSNSIGMSFAAQGKEGKILGKAAAANTAALVAGSAVLLLLFRFFSLSYAGAFFIGSGAFVCSAFCIVSMDGKRMAPLKRKLVVKREFSLYYLLAILYGGRKQLFLTFGPWMLVDLFRQSVSTMTALFFIVSVLGIFVKPLIGRLIDGKGERFVLGAEAFLIAFICLVYAFARDLLPSGAALAAVAAAYVLDQSSNSVSMARATYVKKVAKNPEDVSPTLSLGISIDHIVSMTVPMLGGLVWRSAGNTGYKWVFLGGTAICILNFIATRFISITARKISPRQEGPQCHPK